MVDAAHGQLLFRKVTASLDLGSGFDRAWKAAAEAGEEAHWSKWEAWIRRCAASVKGPKVKNPAGLFIHKLEQGPDCDLVSHDALDEPRSTQRDQEAYFDKVRTWADTPLMPSIAEGTRVYRENKHLGADEAMEAVRRFYHRSIAEREEEAENESAPDMEVQPVQSQGSEGLGGPEATTPVPRDDRLPGELQEERDLGAGGSVPWWD